MIIKCNTPNNVNCIGSFASEVTGQFQCNIKKGLVYLFNIKEITENELVISNLLTNETSNIPLTSIKKVKTLDGKEVNYEKFTQIEQNTAVMQILSSGTFECLNNQFETLTLNSVTIQGTVVTFSDGTNTYETSQLYLSSGVVSLS